MAIDRTKLSSLVGGIQHTDPRLFIVLTDIIAELDAQENPAPSAVARLDALSATVLPGNVVTFEYTLLSRHLELTWENPDSVPRFFQIRKG